MSDRGRVVAGMIAGAIWALGLVGLAQAANLPFLPPPLAIPGALIAPGLVTVAMIGRLAQRRFFDDTLVQGQDFRPGSAAWLDQKVLSNTIEQLVLALVIWPFVALTLGGGVVLALGFGFAVARLAFWIGYHVAPSWRAFGFAATFYPTVLAGIWSVVVWMI